MTKQEVNIASAVYTTIKDQAVALSIFDKMVLANALKEDLSFEGIPSKQQRLFLDVAMAVVRALQHNARTYG